VRNNGTVNSGENDTSSVMSDAGTGGVAPGGTGGNPYHQRFQKHHRCSVSHAPPSASPRIRRPHSVSPSCSLASSGGPGPERACASITSMTTDIRNYAPPDEEAVVALSLRAWTPVFASLEQALGGELLALFHPDWRQDQEKAVRAALADPAMRVWVPTDGSQPIGYVAATLHQDRLMGEIHMLAVDPAHQHRGAGAALTEAATEWLRGSGMRVAMVETGGDPGHAPARQVYQRAGYIALPVARYFKALPPRS
jgi:GNAT superfamily N-acetyltransferase